MHKRLTGGFTLIELLVVIAIIGILAGIVLAALGNARSAAVDTGIKGNVDTVRTQAELYANTNGNYGAAQTAAAAAPGNACGTLGVWADPTVAAATKAASSAGGVTTASFGGAIGNSVVCVSSPTPTTFWLVAVAMKSDVTKAWCADSTGVAKLSTVANMATLANINALTACPN